MSPRESISDHGQLFGGNTLYEVLHAVASRRGKPFHGASIAAQVGRTEAQTQRELAKLAAVGAIKELGGTGRAQRRVVAKSRLARTLFSLPRLIEQECGAYPRNLER
jgi:hypothetical protein